MIGNEKILSHQMPCPHRIYRHLLVQQLTKQRQAMPAVFTASIAIAVPFTGKGILPYFPLLSLQRGEKGAFPAAGKTLPSPLYGNRSSHKQPLCIFSKLFTTKPPDKKGFVSFFPCFCIVLFLIKRAASICQSCNRSGPL